MTNGVLASSASPVALSWNGTTANSDSRHNVGFFEALARAYRVRVGMTQAAKHAQNTNLFAATPGPSITGTALETVAMAPTGATPIAANRPTGSIADFISAAARQESVPPALLTAVVHVESGFQPNAVSPVGAKGLTQLMDGTARSLGVTDSFDPWQNLVGGARFLRGLLSRYNGNVTLAVAAYNAGPGAVDSYGGTVPPYAETQSYVRQVLGAYHHYQASESPGGSQ